MKIIVPKDIKRATRKQLKYAYNQCAKDLYFSTGEGLDFFNGQLRMEDIKKEIKRRRIKLNKFVGEIQKDIEKGQL